MRIETLGGNYEILRYEYSDNDMERCICREENSGVQCSMIRIRNKGWIMQTMEFLMQQLENRHFTDFIACFAEGGALCLAMAYPEGISLAGRLQEEECSLEERLVIGGNILQKILLQDMPLYFLQDCLSGESICLTPDLEVGFRYELTGISGYDKVKFVHVLGKLQGLFDTLFAKELRQRMIPPLNRFSRSLAAGKYKDIMELYRAYTRMQKLVKEIPPEETGMPDTWGFVLWDRIRKVFEPLKKVLALLLMLCAVLFLMDTVRRQLREDGEKRIFEYIGTLEIQEGTGGNH